MSNLVTLLYTKKYYFLLSLATLLSAIGTAFTTVAVYGELAKQGAPIYYYSFAFVIGFIPSLFTAQLSGKISHKINIGKILFFTEVIGAAALIFPMIGYKFQILPLLLFAELIGSCITGFLAPCLQTYTRRIFKDHELQTISNYNVYVFTAQFILGQALGTVLYLYFGTLIYFIIDFFTYLLSAFIILSVIKKFPEDLKGSAKINAVRFSWRKLTKQQKKAFLINPLLVISCAPVMSVLPAIGRQFGTEWKFGIFILSPALIFLMAKTIGQFLGPLLVKNFNYNNLVKNLFFIPLLLLLYHISYIAVINSTNFVVSFCLVIVAHTFSNVIFILGYYYFTKQFAEEQIGQATARHFQLSMSLMCLSGIYAGFIGDLFSIKILALLSLFFFIMISMVFVYLSKDFIKTDEKENKYATG